MLPRKSAELRIHGISQKQWKTEDFQRNSAVAQNQTFWSPISFWQVLSNIKFKLSQGDNSSCKLFRNCLSQFSNIFLENFVIHCFLSTKIMLLNKWNFSLENQYYCLRTGYVVVLEVRKRSMTVVFNIISWVLCNICPKFRSWNCRLSEDFEVDCGIHL